MSTLITVTQLLGLCDAVAAEYDYRAAALDAGTAKTTELYNRIVGTPSINGLADFTNINQFGKTVNAYLAISSSAGYYGNNYQRIIQAWQTGIQNLGATVSTSIVGLDTFASYYNGITPYSCLYSWEFATVFNLCNPTLRLSPQNVFCPGGSTAPYSMVTPGGAVTINPGTALGSGTITSANTTTFVAGATVPLVNSTNVQGFCGPLLELVATSNFNNTGTMTVTGVDNLGNADTTWTIPLTAITTGQTIEANGTTRISQVTAVAVSGAITAGGWILRAKQERAIS